MRAFFILLFLCSISTWPLPAGAAHPVLLAQAASSADEAAAMARQRTRGRVLGVDWNDSGNGPVYLVRVLLPDGSIRVVTISARGNR